MTEEEMLTRLCALMSEVRSKIFNNAIPFDCFCGENELAKTSNRYYSEEVLAFVEQTVRGVLP